MMESVVTDNNSEEDMSPERGAYFPRSYVTELYRLLRSRRDLFEIITYADLDWAEGDDPEAFYPLEHKRWIQSLKSGRRDPAKIYVLIQYDVDSVAERTMGLLRDPAHRGIPANVMIFNRRIDRRRLVRSGELAVTPYAVDDDLLQGLERDGTVIGYHINAHEQALFDMDRASAILREDLAELRKRYNIRFVSAHGGAPGPGGRNNRDVPYGPDLQRDVIWVHNGRSPHFFKTYSDGGHNRSPDPTTRDLRDFVRGMRPGRRYRILLHPQYYDVTARASQRFAGTPWYDQVLRESATPGASAHWTEIAAATPFVVPPPSPPLQPAPVVAPPARHRGLLRRLRDLAAGRSA